MSTWDLQMSGYTGNGNGPPLARLSAGPGLSGHRLGCKSAETAYGGSKHRHGPLGHEHVEIARVVSLPVSSDDVQLSSPVHAPVSCCRRSGRQVHRNALSADLLSGLMAGVGPSDRLGDTPNDAGWTLLDAPRPTGSRRGNALASRIRIAWKRSGIRNP